MFMAMRSFKNFAKNERSKQSARYLRIAHFSADSGLPGSYIGGKFAQEWKRCQPSASQYSTSVGNLEEDTENMDIGSHPPSLGARNKEYLNFLPKNKNLLYLEKRSRGHTIEWQELRCYAIFQKLNGYRHRLDHHSCNKVVQRVMRRDTSPQRQSGWRQPIYGRISYLCTSNTRILLFKRKSQLPMTIITSLGKEFRAKMNPL